MYFLDFSYVGINRNQHSATNNVQDKSNEQIKKDKLSTQPEDEKLNLDKTFCQTNESQDTANEQGTTTPLLTILKAVICALFVYECYFDFIIHLPIITGITSEIFATVFRVQVLLIMISVYILPEKIVRSLVNACIYQTGNKENCCFKRSTCSDFFFPFSHIMRFRTCKHKRQNLVLKTDWRSVLNRFSNFKTKFLDKQKQTGNKVSSESNNQIQLPTSTELVVTHYLLFCLCVISLPGLILILLIISKVETFSKVLYNLPNNWREKIVWSHSHPLSRHHYLYVLCVIFGNVAINSFCTAFVLENFPTLSSSCIVPVSIIERNILSLCGFTTLMCFYFLLLYVGDYGVLLLFFFLAFLFQFTGNSFTIVNFWSGDTILAVLAIYECILVDLFNIFLFLPGNLLCFVPHFKPYVIQVFVKDWYGKSHIFRLIQDTTAADLKKQISFKLHIPQTEYWLSGPGGKNIEDWEKLTDKNTFEIRGRLLGGNDECCIKGCPEIASQRKITGLVGVYELKISPNLLAQSNDLNLKICNHHYHLQRKRGHKPNKLYSSVKSGKKLVCKTNPKSELLDNIPFLGVKTCSSSKNNAVVTKTKPCPLHVLTVASKSYMCACNCLDEITEDKIQQINNDLYDCISTSEEPLINSDLEQRYICTECSPAYLKLLKENQKGDFQTGSHTQEDKDTDKKVFQESASEVHQTITFPFSEFFSDSDHCSTKNNITLNDYESICNLFLKISKKQFSPWEVCLQHGQTGIKLHFYLQCNAETLPTKKLTIFCPFLFGAPYNISFSVYALGKQVDNGFLPNYYFENEIQAQNITSSLLDTLFMLQPCLGIYDKNFIKTIKMNQLQENLADDPMKTYKLDSGYLLKNHYGKDITETIRSVDLEKLCNQITLQPRAERCQNCTLLLRKLTRLLPDTSTDKCSSESHVPLSNLTFEQLLERYKNLKKTCDYWKKRHTYYLKKQKMKPPPNFDFTSTTLGRLVDTAVKNNLLKQNSVLYLLLLDAVLGLQKQEKEFTSNDGKVTKTKKKPRAKGMRYHPLVIKWCCCLASKCREKGYESIRHILPLPHWQTIRQYRQTTSSSEPINKENLKRMVKEMERRNCKAIGGIHWDEMIIQEGIVVCKRTGELVGFENLDMPKEITNNFDSIQNEDEESQSDSESNETSSSSTDSDSDDYSRKNLLKAKMLCQFFFSSVEGDFSWPVASFPVKQLNSRKLKALVWNVIEILSKTIVNGKPIQIFYGVCDGSSYSHAFFRQSNIQNWVCSNPYNNNEPIWWLSDYPHLIKKLRNFIVNPERQLEWSEQKITSKHLLDVVERKQTKLRWKHIKLSARTKMSVKRAVEVCSEEVISDICQGSFPLEETIGTRMYLSLCEKLFKIMNNSTQVDPSSFRELVKILIWFTKWYNEIKMTMPEKGQRKAHWRKFITERTYKDLIRSIRAFLGLVQYIQMNYPDAIIIPKTMCQDDVENYLSLQQERIASGQPTVLQYFESAATINTNL